MPHKMWKHQCKDGPTVAMGTEICPDCGTRGEYDGWWYSRIDAMSQYQKRTGLKPIGPHRPMADDLLERHMKMCEQCNGRGLLDINNGENYESCPLCQGIGCLFDGSLEQLESLRRRILASYPDAALDDPIITWGLRH